MTLNIYEPVSLQGDYLSSFSFDAAHTKSIHPSFFSLFSGLAKYVVRSYIRMIAMRHTLISICFLLPLVAGASMCHARAK